MDRFAKKVHVARYVVGLVGRDQGDVDIIVTRCSAYPFAGQRHRVAVRASYEYRRGEL